MHNVTFTEFEEFEKENKGNADRYMGNKEVNERIHNDRKEKNDNKIFTMSDWRINSEEFALTHTWDYGQGKFVTLDNLSVETIKIKRRRKIEWGDM